MEIKEAEKTRNTATCGFRLWFQESIRSNSDEKLEYSYIGILYNIRGIRVFFGEIDGKIKFEGDVYTRGKDIFVFLFRILNFETWNGKLYTSIYLYLNNESLIKLNYIYVIWKINRDAKVIFILSFSYNLKNKSWNKNYY